MERRKEELEKKRQKLAELRRAREERKHVQRDPEKTPAAGPTGVKTKDDVDDLVQSILKERSRTPVGSAPGPDSDGGSDKGSNVAPPVAIPTQLTSSSSVPQSPAVPTSGRFLFEFSNFEAVILDIAPKEVVFYNKEVQTSTTSFAPPPPSEEEIRAKLEKEFEEREQAKLAAQEEERLKQEAARKKIEQAKELNDKERETIIGSAEFGKFIERSAKIMERALSEKYDFMIDYSISQNLDEENDESGLRVKLACTFFDDKWSQKRSVTDVNWSHKHPELSVASYNKNPMAMNEPDGIVLVWNLHSLNTPEFVFHSQSDVLTTAFSPFHPTTIIGGTYSGQIVLWDMRAKSLPVLKSPLSSAGHTHPVYSMQMVGTQNAHNLITASTDGLVCSWQLDMLAQPQETLELVHPNHSKTDEVSVTAIGFPENETTSFWVGTEEGNVYQANRFDRAGSKAGINQYDYYKGHWGPITGLQFHPLVGPVDFSDLFITSSVDWTVKLWRAKSSSKPNTAATDIKPLYSFEGADDYVYDVKWSPNHPALFGSVDGTGKFSLWNLNVDTEIPIVSTEVGQKALNKINWDKDGKKVAIGSSDGRVHVYDIGEMCHPRPDEWTSLQKNVAEMIATTESEYNRAATK